MRVVNTAREMRETALRLRRDGKRIGLVPTMGYLHAGHISLVERARQLSDFVVVSVFVNPIQFGPREDLGRYPRDFDRDRKLCEEAGVDALFFPSAEDMYADNHSVYVTEEKLSAGLCGAARPGHFRGVATVVAKLFNIAQPGVAVFGQKDAQQAKIIRRMARDLNFPVEVIVAPTVREADGLAMSSRNSYLKPEERRLATSLRQALRLAADLRRQGIADSATIKRKMREMLESAPGMEVEYVETVDLRDLEPVEKMDGLVLVALAVRIGRTRLIDNAIVAPDGEVEPPQSAWDG